MSVSAKCHIEDLLDALKAFLVADLPAALTAITADQDDAITIPMPNTKDIVLGMMDISNYDDYPVVFLVPVGEEYEELTMETDLLRGVIGIWVVVGGYDPDKLPAMTWRYGAGVRNSIRNDPSLDDTVDESIVSGITYHPVMVGDDELQAVRVTVEISKEIS